MTVMILRRPLERLKKFWVSCFVSTILMVGWQYSVGIPMISFQNFVILLAIPITFSSDFSYTNYKNVRQKLSKRSQKVGMFFSGIPLALSFIWLVYVDTFHTDAVHYLTYFCIAALWLFLVFRAANKE